MSSNSVGSKPLLNEVKPPADVTDFEWSELSKLNSKSGRNHAEARLIIIASGPACKDHFCQRANHNRREHETMQTLEKDVKRMELQIGQLISIVANQNERLNRVEEMERRKRITSIQRIPLAERM